MKTKQTDKPPKQIKKQTKDIITAMWNWKWEQKKLLDDTKKQAKCGYPNWTLTMTLEQQLINYAVLGIFEYMNALDVLESTFNPKDSAADNKSCFIFSLFSWSWFLLPKKLKNQYT